MNEKIKYICSIEFCDDQILNLKNNQNNLIFISTRDMCTSLLKIEFINVLKTLDTDKYDGCSLLGNIKYEGNNFIIPIDNGEPLIVSCCDIIINNMEEKDKKYTAFLR